MWRLRFFQDQCLRAWLPSLLLWTFQRSNFTWLDREYQFFSNSGVGLPYRSTTSLWHNCAALKGNKLFWSEVEPCRAFPCGVTMTGLCMSTLLSMIKPALPPSQGGPNTKSEEIKGTQELNSYNTWEENWLKRKLDSIIFKEAIDD